MKRKLVLWLILMVGLLSFAGIVYSVAYAAGDPTLEMDRRGTAIQGALTPMVAQSIAFDAAASNSTAFKAKIVRVTATTACFIRLGTASTGQTATAAYHYMGAGTTEYFRTRGFTYISAIKALSAGTLYISEME